MTVEYFVAKRKIAVLWFVVTGIILGLMFLQMLMGKYEDKITEAWGWIFPNTLPTLSLILTVLVLDVRRMEEDKFLVDRTYFKIALGLSVMYLLSILTIIIVQPFTGVSIIKLMKDSNLFLGPFQGLVNAAVGVFFVKRQ